MASKTAMLNSKAFSSSGPLRNLPIFRKLEIKWINYSILSNWLEHNRNSNVFLRNLIVLLRKAYIISTQYKKDPF
jgi:hypothetical protein